MESLLFERYFKIKFSKMKDEDLQKLVLYKYEKGESSTKIFQDLNGFVSSRTIRRWSERQVLSIYPTLYYQDQRNDPKGEKTNET